MARHPWVAKADNGVRWGVQLVAENGRRSAMDRDVKDNPRTALFESGKLVDSLGFDGLFIYDHPGQAPGPWVWLGGLAAVTENVMLGSVVNCVFYRHPVSLARHTSDLDHLSQGRVMLGVGCGYLPKEFAWFGADYQPAAQRQEALEEVLEIVQGAWGSDPFTFNGKYYDLDDVRIEPAPVQQPRPPIMLAGGGERVTLRQVARLADACNITAPEPDKVRQKFEALEQHCQEVGRPYDEVLRTTFTGWLIISETEAEAEAKLNSYYPEGIPKAIRDRINPTVGGVDQIIEHYQALADAGVQYFVTQIIDGDDRETIELLAKRVVPEVS